MRWSSGIISGILTGIITLLVLFVIWFIINFGNKKDITLNDILPTREFTLKELSSEVAQPANPKEPAMGELASIDSSEKDDNNEVQFNYYIIVGSFRNLVQAQQKAENLTNNFNANFLILPPTKEGNYRISCGKYSTLEEAKATIKSIRTNINPDAWIFSLKE